MKKLRFVFLAVGLLLLAYWLWPSGTAPAPAPSSAHAAALEPVAEDADADGGPGIATASLSGRVTEGPDAGVPGALVAAVDSTGRIARTTSGAGGAYRFDTLDPGAWTLQAQAGAAISDPAGPIPAAAGDDLRGLDLPLLPGVSVSGRILDQRTRTGVLGAAVSIAASPFSATSGADGRYFLPAVPAGRQTLLVLADGYLPRRAALDYPSGSKAAGVDVYLSEAAHIEGAVIDASGGGVPGASLFVWRYQAAGDAPLTPLGVTSGDDGSFSADVQPGVVRLVARASGFAEGQSAQLDLPEGGRQSGVRVKLSAGGEIDGTVLLPNGSPAGSGRVQAIGGAGGWPAAQAAVGADGTFKMTAVPAGRVTVVADAAQARGSAETTLDEGGAAQVEIRLGDGKIDGIVEGAGGQPVAGALVVARPVGVGLAGERQALSKDDGTFALTGLSGARFDLAASKDDGSAEAKGVPAGARGVRLSLALGRVSGWVTTPDSGGVSDFTLSAEPEVPGRGRPRSVHPLDGRGEFSIALAPGTYLLRATAPGYAEGDARGVGVSAGEETSGVTIELRASGTIDGIVRDAASGAPVVGVHVAIDRSHVFTAGRVAGGGSGATSGLDGSFTIRDVSPGSWPVFAASEDYEQAGGPPWVTVKPGEDAPPVEIRVHRAGASREKEFAGVGLSFWDQGGHKRVIEVFPGSPASEAGVRGGDEILAVDGSPVGGMSMSDLSARIRGPAGTELTLDMQQPGGAAYSVTLARGDIKLF